MVEKKFTTFDAKLHGNFQNKSILSMQQLDRASLLRLTKVTEKLHAIDQGPLWSCLPSSLERSIIGVFSKDNLLNETRVIFSKAIDKFGGRIIEVDEKLIATDKNRKSNDTPIKTPTSVFTDLQGVCDLIILIEPDEELLKEAKRSIKPVMNASLIKELTKSKEPSYKVATSMALLTLIAEK
jgi:aspartate carbamoyltransferase catalytic subunit